MPFALEVWFGHNGVTFICEDPLSGADEQAKEKGKDDEEYRQSDEWSKPTQHRRESSYIYAIVREAA